MNWLEIVGYCGSVLVAVSLMMKSIKKLRWINLFGSSTFSLYGLLVGAYPVFLLNAFIAIVDVYYLLQMKSLKDYFTILPINPTSKYMKKFSEYYYKDIKKFFPDFDSAEQEKATNVFILRNMLPVGLVSYIVKDKSAKIILDYAIPDYRDLKNAHFLMSCGSNHFIEQGINELIAEGQTEPHAEYLGKIGFKLFDEKSKLYRKMICKNESV